VKHLMRDEDAAAESLTIIARALAYLAMHAGELMDSDLATKSEFLEDRLGLSRADTARLLTTTTESVRVARAKRQTKGRSSRG
jgi:hypothetical protein